MLVLMRSDIAAEAVGRALPGRFDTNKPITTSGLGPILASTVDTQPDVERENRIGLEK